MNSLLRIAGLLLIASSCRTHGESESRLPAQIDSLFASVPDFSGVVLVAEAGKPVYARAFGYRDAETSTPLDTADVFEFASVSKQFTAMVIMMLQEQGRLNYDDPVDNYLHDLPYAGITIRHLLTHTSGLPDYQQVMDEHWDKSKAAGNEEIIEYLKRYHPERLFVPGSKYSYSNTGYVLLGSIAETASGEDFVQFSRRNIFNPLQMRSTDIRSLAEKAAARQFARGYIYAADRHRFVPADSFPSSNYVFWLGNRKGPGRVSGTAGDLLKWDRSLYTERLVKRKTLDQAFLPLKLSNDSISNYGFGWMLRTHPSLGKVVWHSGDNPGYKTAIVRYVDADKTVIILCNNAHEKFKSILSDIDLLLGKNPL